MNSLLQYFQSKKYDKNDWKTYPIILRWMYLDHMIDVLNVIDPKVQYLMQHSRSKLREWFSSDSALTQITAERYILDYLRLNNNSLEENFKGSGVDAYLNMGNERFGLEVTTINSCIPEWIFNERLHTYLDAHNYSRKNTIEISYSLEDIKDANYTLNTVELVGQLLMSGGSGNVGDITIKNISGTGSLISWNHKSQQYNLFTTLEDRLNEIIQRRKKQLVGNKKNLLFIGVNQLPHSEHVPGIFREIAKPVRYTDEVGRITDIISKVLPPNVIGVCFFTYSLDRVEPMYPLKIFWRDSRDEFSINL